MQKIIVVAKSFSTKKAGISTNSSAKSVAKYCSIQGEQMEFKYDLPNSRKTQKYSIKNSISYKRLKKVRGVYALFDNGQLVYIGMSIDLWRRLQGHKVLAKDGEELFTEYTIQEFSNSTKAEISIYEAIYINYYQPVYNKGVGLAYLYS